MCVSTDYDPLLAFCQWSNGVYPGNRGTINSGWPFVKGIGYEPGELAQDQMPHQLIDESIYGPEEEW